MKNTNLLIQVTGHIRGNDFRGKTTWTVADFRKMHAETTTICAGTVTVDAEEYYLESGYHSVTITDTGNRFNRRFEITLTRMVPEITEFDHEWQARKHAELINR